MSEEWPTLAEVIQTGIDTALSSVAKALPGTVVSYDSVTETCTVRPGVHRRVPSITDPDSDEVEELPALQFVPVAWPRARGFSFAPTAGLLPGDKVLLIACDRDISGWRRSGQPSEPDDARTHTWAGCVALPGLQADVGRFPVPTDAAALASKLDALIVALKAAANGDAIPGAVTTLFPDVVGGSGTLPTVTTTGSSIAKLGG